VDGRVDRELEAAICRECSGMDGGLDDELDAEARGEGPNDDGRVDCELEADVCREGTGVDGGVDDELEAVARRVDFCGPAVGLLA